MTEKKSIWRMPIMWLVVGLPLASIVAGVGLVITAVNTGGTDSVTDKVDRVSQIQTTDLGPDSQAQALKLSAIVRIDAGMVEVLPVTGEFKRNAPLRLSLEHPLQAQEDRVLVALDVGQPLWADITPAAARELALAPGTPVHVLLKARNLRALPVAG